MVALPRGSTNVWKLAVRFSTEQIVDETVLFFFSSRRRHTRFDCDWSSDVCSSDLRSRQSQRRQKLRPRKPWLRTQVVTVAAARRRGGESSPRFTARVRRHPAPRSGEGRGGEECRSRGSPDHLKKKKRR